MTSPDLDDLASSLRRGAFHAGTRTYGPEVLRPWGFEADTSCTVCRSYFFDPWLFRPMAYVEHWIRGIDSQINLEKPSYGVRGWDRLYQAGPLD